MRVPCAERAGRWLLLLARCHSMGGARTQDQGNRQHEGLHTAQPRTAAPVPALNRATNGAPMSEQGQCDDCGRMRNASLLRTCSKCGEKICGACDEFHARDLVTSCPGMREFMGPGGRP